MSKFGKNLFQKKTVVEPTFSSNEGMDYFAHLYQDLNRDANFVPLPEMKRPPTPHHFLSEECPSQKEILEVLRAKRNDLPRAQMVFLTFRTNGALHSCPSSRQSLRKFGQQKKFQKLGPTFSFFQNPKRPQIQRISDRLL